MNRPILHGGTIMLPAPCSYSVTTRDGASAPAMGSASFGADPTPTLMHLGIASDAARSMVVQWRTKDETTLATRVQFGVGTATDQSADGFTFQFSTGFSNDGPLVRVHEVHLCGLQPDTQYSYRVGGLDGSGHENWSPVYQFRTAPDPSVDTEVVLGVLGDSRDGYAMWGQIVQMLASTGMPDLILFSGDAVTLGPVQSEWDQFFAAAEPVLRQVPMISAHGNHDLNSVNYYSLFPMPGDREDYGLTYGPVHLTVANDSPVDVADLTGRGAQFLQSDLTMNDSAPWKIVMHHRPIWSASARHGGDMMLQTTWGPIFDMHKVDLVLNGHDHDYERTKPMRGSTPQASSADGTVYVVSGGAGAELYDNGTGFWTQISEKTLSFLVLRARRGMLELRALRPDGTMIDTFMLSKP